MGMSTIEEIGKCQICQKNPAVILVLKHSFLCLDWNLICRDCLQFEKLIKANRRM